MDEPNVEFPQSTQTVNALKLHKNKPQKTAQDWVRDMRMSAAVNKANVGVETEMVTPDLLLATSKKLLGISKHEQEPDPKDSLAFQRFYGPETLFSEHIQRDGGKLGRNLLWKATNRGNLDFMPVGALEKHISSVFYDSKLAQMMDGSSPLETIDSAYKTTRIGEGGVGSVDSAPEEMRTVQPSYFGYIDPVRSPESFRVGLDVYMTKNVMKGTDGKLYQKFIDAKTGKEVLLDSETAANSVIASPEMMEAKTKSVFALGGPTGVRIVPRSSIQYYLPRADEAYSTSSNLVTMFSGVKEARLQMGCLHPDMAVLTVDEKGMIEIKKAKNIGSGILPGSTSDGTADLYPIRTTVAKFPPKKNWFVKVILRSGRALITSADHRWPVLRKGQYQLVEAGKLQPGDIALRSSFNAVPTRKTFLNGIQVSKAFAKVLGYIVRSLAEPDSAKMRIEVPEYEKDFVFDQLSRYGFREGFNTYYMNGRFCIGIRDIKLKEWLRENVGATNATRKVPSIIMSAGVLVVSSFLDGYSADATKVGMDSNDDMWILEIPNLEMRDSLAFLFSRIATDSLYRDSISTGELELAIKLVPMEPTYGDMIKDPVKVIKKKYNAPIMVDIDINDNLYATANGIVTHNSKYPLQAISLEEREAPLVRGLDEASGKDIHSLIGKYLGARFAPQDGIVTAVRKDRIDVMYDDGTKGSVGLYVNFPMNAKGYINNIPQVKAGQPFKKGDILASSNYTDDKGTAALGKNLRAAWMSWKGGTYEDAILISESAAKKLTSTTMYKTSVDMDKTIKLGKNNYVTWKPAEFTKEQLETLDNTGVVKPGTLLHKDDPMILAVQVSEPSPGTLGKRVLSDVSEKWEHDKPGVVTDVVKTKRGIKVYATVTAPVEIGDKLSGCFDDKTEVFTERGFVLFKDLTLDDKIAVLQPDGSATFEYPLAYQVDDYKGCMIEHKTKRSSMLITPNHNVAYVPRYEFENGDTRLVKKTAVEVYNHRIFMRVSACFAGVLAQPEIDTIILPEYTDIKRAEYAVGARMLREFKRSDFAAFLGIYLAEGHTAHKKGQHWIRISQYDKVDGGEERCAEIAELLDRMGLEWHYYDHQYFVINNWPLEHYLDSLGNSYGKHIPGEVFSDWSKADMETLLDWFYMGDGEKTLDPDGYQRCATVSKQLADDLQRLYILTGRYSTVHSTNAKNARSGKVYKISSAYKEFLGYGQKKGNWKIVDDYEGKIYCVTSSTGIILTRRDGIPVWNGQSYGNKGEVAQIIPDDQMPHTAKGEPIDLVFSPLGIITRTNPAQVAEALLGKVAAKTGKPIVVPHFMKESIADYVDKMMKQYHVSPEDDMVDPETGRVIKGVTNGYSYIYKLKHLAESKMSARGTSSYDAEEVPGGKGFDSSKRFGTLESSAMAGHQAMENLKDAKYIRGQSNADFWRSIRTGDIPTMPGEPLVHKKFFAHLTGSGINVRKTPQGVSIFALTNEDVDELAGTREVKSRDTYETRNYRPIDGGLFGQDIFGMNGDKWGYIKLDEPVPNPVMEEPLARLLNIPEKKFADVAAGKEEINGIRGSVAMKEALAKMNLQVESEKALQGFKTASASGKDKALKRYVAIERMRRSSVNPADYMLDKIPVLPPQFRPITSYNGLTMVADSNYLYAQLIDARDDMREARALPKVYQQQARENLYKRWKELTGLYAPEDVKLQSKHVQGLLKWALGDSPKFSGFQRKVLSSTVDTVGRGVVVPDPRLKLNELGLPLEMAFNIMAPFVERALVQRGYTPLQAMEKVKKQDVQARDILNEVMKTHPVLMNRAPTLHKLGIMAYNPRLVTGHAIHVNPSTVVPFNMDFDGDTVNVHVPVSDAARKEAYNRMMPERNLISMRKREILYKPEKEYQQGLYIGTRMKKGDTVRTHYFDTVEEARKAFREGIIDIDDPIEIKYK